VAGRFPLFMDACVRGPIVEALARQGWDLVRAVDIQGEGAKDRPLFGQAAQLGRVFVTNDQPLLKLAMEWLREGRPFRMVFWSKVDDARYSVGVVAALDGLAHSKDDPFAYPIVYLKP
jgi:hypothetical protein